MTRVERIEAAARAIWSEMPYTGDIGPGVPGDGRLAGVVRHHAEVALEAALADLGGLDGLTLLADLTDQSRPPEDRKDRDRLREALANIARADSANGTASKAWLCGRLNSVAEIARNALRESEAGT